jgi:hypothetical protein
MMIRIGERGRRRRRSRRRGVLVLRPVKAVKNLDCYQSENSQKCLPPIDDKEPDDT